MSKTRIQVNILIGICIIFAAVATFVKIASAQTAVNNSCLQYSDPNAQNVCNNIMNHPKYGIKKAQQDFMDEYRMPPPAQIQITQIPNSMGGTSSVMTTQATPPEIESTQPASPQVSPITGIQPQPTSPAANSSSQTTQQQTQQPTTESQYYPKSVWERMKRPPSGQTQQEQQEQQSYYNIYQ